MKRRLLFVTALAIAATGCSGREPDTPPQPPPVLTGKWIRHGELGGGELPMWVTPTHATFDMEIDTIYMYQYQRRGDVLEMRDDRGRPAPPARVLKLTADSLVLDFALPGTTRPMRFWRDRRDPGDTLRIGSRLYDADGELWGTVVGMEFLHRFPNGVIEAGVLVDHGPRAGKPRLPPQWVSRRSAERFTRR
ncbi:MAG TPA: hypothetical protein VFS20_10015 [Longimicrobium sp.]|nr:hypothetical protein [Longimicrobium sp.]